MHSDYVHFTQMKRLVHKSTDYYIIFYKTDKTTSAETV